MTDQLHNDGFLKEVLYGDMIHVVQKEIKDALERNPVDKKRVGFAFFLKIELPPELEPIDFDQIKDKIVFNILGLTEKEEEKKEAKE